jgi:uncharacterized RDD family membrane protein YckC
MSENSPLAGFAPVPGNDETLELNPAKISDRFIAYFIDILPFAVGFCASLFIIVFRLQTAAPNQALFRRLGALWAGLLFFYQFVGNLTGGTVGKRLMGLRVVRLDGKPLGVVRSLARAVGYFLSTPLCNFGFLIALVHPESRTLHDILSGALVVETRAKHPAETFILFLAAVCAVGALFLGNLFYTVNQPTPADLLAVEKAQDGLKILARIEEAFKEKNGHYTKSLADLAQASGDAEEFKKAMLEIFEPNLFRLEAGTKGYRISASAKDRKKTRVSIEGPLPSVP